MKRMKHLLSWVLVIGMMLSLAAVPAFASSGSDEGWGVASWRAHR